MSTSIALLGLGFSLGFMHALDADHVMAVSSLNNKRPGLSRMLRFCANWALGHGGILLFSGLLLFGLGWHLPPSLQQAAEISVGIMLIALGLWCFWQFKHQNITLERHAHDDVDHVHLHVLGDVTEQGHGQQSANQKIKRNEGHAPVMVGVLHGLAGSAPALALVPATSQGNYVLALGYLLVFSVGVMISMLFFGLGLGSIQDFLQRHYAKLFQVQRYLIASASVLLGAFWLSQTV